MKFKAIALALIVTLPGGCVHASREAGKPLYRDPVFDGAADVSIVHDKARHDWLMFYTNRRATLKLPDKDVSWVHGTRIGIAESKDGRRWRYKGIADIPAACTGATLWAPEIYADGGTYHMWLTVVPGIFKDWNAPRAIVHLTSPDLEHWHCGETLDLGSNRVIDASVYRVGDRYRLWFKDETRGSRIFAAESRDLKTWVRDDRPVADIAAEGPKVFRFGGAYWLIADAWKGLIVLRSDDGVHWDLQPSRLLEKPGVNPTDNFQGQHPDVVVNNGRALIYYFVQQKAASEAAADPWWGQRSVIQVAELKLQDGWLTVDRNAPVDGQLTRPD